MTETKKSPLIEVPHKFKIDSWQGEIVPGTRVETRIPPEDRVVRVDPTDPNVFLNVREIASRSHLLPELSPELVPGHELRFIGQAINAARAEARKA
ncbi:hypothetical protein D3C72_1748380 [compost metagenome]